ncbi:MAG: glycoside hydrolase family 16 protein [Fibrobacter sp.]|nr:glycoside hydrolase family 16 protein [Fibrobacter sp.]
MLVACSDDTPSAPDTQPESSSTIEPTSSELASSSSSVTLGISSSIAAPVESSSSGEIEVPSSSAEMTSSSSETGNHGSSAEMTSSSSSAAITSSSESPYLWNDEFDTIDTAKWTFEIGTGASGWGNNEKQYYTGRSENAYVQDGILHIRANKESYEGSGYTSARMITKGKFTFTYGTVEARIALPVGKGIWPAFWMLGENIDRVSWPACGEIDIIEAVNSENIVYGTNHWSYNGDHAQYGNNTGDYYGTSKKLDITEFHTYKFTWDKELITMYVDDFKYHEISIKDNAGGTDAFHKPFFFILNVAVGGNWPKFDIDDSQFPNEMLVDYIRVSR